MFSKGIFIFYTEIKERWEPSFFEKKLALLPLQFQSRIKKYANWQDQQLRLVNKLLLQKLLDIHCQQKKISLNNLYFDKYNKPVLPYNLYTSSSHSGNIAICALSFNAPIGIDIELKRQVDPNISEYFFCKKEQKDPSRFFEVWTRKEAVIKANGIGVDKVDLSLICASQPEVYLNGKLYKTIPLVIHPDYEAQIASTDLSEINLVTEKVFF